jgi:hypothetical protein
LAIIKITHKNLNINSHNLKKKKFLALTYFGEGIYVGMEPGQFAKYWFILQNADLGFHLEGAEGGGESGAVNPLLPCRVAAKIKRKNIGIQAQQINF